MTRHSDGDQRESLAGELSRLSSLDDVELHRLWRVRIGRAVPLHLPRGLFVRLLSYKLQEQAYGGLDRATRAKLKATNGREGNSEIPSSPYLGLKPGTVLVREHDGQLQRVMVLDQGFAWSGKTYRSLSEAAFAITGTKWNGRRFFGLDQKEKRPAAKGVGT